MFVTRKKYNKLKRNNKNLRTVLELFGGDITRREAEDFTYDEVMSILMEEK